MSVTFNEAYRDSEETKRGYSIYSYNKSDYGRRVSRKGSVVNPSAPPPPTGTLVHSDRAYSSIAETLPDFADLHDDHREQTEKETSMGFWKGLKTYPTAAAWSVLLSSSIIMEGYDTNLLGSFFAYPIFNQKYGDQLPSGIFEVSANWQTGLTNGAQAGSIIGLCANGFLCDKFGYKKTYMLALILVCLRTILCVAMIHG